MNAAMLSRRISVAAGNEPADYVIKNGKVVDVFNGEIYEADVAIVDGYFAGIGFFHGKTTIDAKGKYISPSFIDGHVHIESTMVCPAEFAKVQLLHGVTTVVTDPHEIANVAGITGIEFMLETTEGIPLDVYFMLPSCVPATSFEHAGAKLERDDLRPFYLHPRVLGLAEVMNFPAVLNVEPSMLAKLTDAHLANKKIDGHAAGLTEEQLNVYTAAGIRTDHECTTAEEARARLRKGMYLMLREGTAAKDVRNLLPAVTSKNAHRCLFVTDDRHLDDILQEGSIDHNVRLSIKEGIPAATAIQMATLNAAECFGLKEIGAIAGGYKADFLLLTDLDDIVINSVYKDGKLVVEKGELINLPEWTLPNSVNELVDSIHFPTLKESDLHIPLTGHAANIITIIPNSLLTIHDTAEVTRDKMGNFLPSTELDLLKLAVVERHHSTGQIGLGIVKGLGLTSGAIATTVSHDSHNLMIAGVNDSDMLMASQEIKEMQGGLVVVNDGKVTARLDLPIAGLMSTKRYEDVYTSLEELNAALLTIGASQHFNPFLTLAFLALPVIPELKLTVQGLFSVSSFQYIPVDVNETDQ